MIKVIDTNKMEEKVAMMMKIGELEKDLRRRGVATHARSGAATSTVTRSPSACIAMRQSSTNLSVVRQLFR